jgi:hypothetical protein
MSKLDLKEYARRGAEVRLRELQAEAAEIFRAFPDLRSAGLRALSASSGPGRGSEVGNGRNRKPMSAAARKAVSLRMKRYWAERRKAS